jgi:5-methylthioribose kinase
MSHLEVQNSKIKPLVYDIDHILNNKWINIRRPQLITQLNQTHQEEIKKDFLHKVIQQIFFVF